MMDTPDVSGTLDHVDFPELAGLSAAPHGQPATAFEKAAKPAPPQTVSARPAVRVLAKLIDTTTAVVLYCLCTLLIESWFVGFFVGGVVASAYLLVSDSLDAYGASRRSFGKRVVGLHLRRLDDAPVDVLASVRRNWMFAGLFFVQAFSFQSPALSFVLLAIAVGAVGYELYWLAVGVRGCRWGDELGDTEVLELRK
jgi:uncharacterized RDD family membrane protein YckC